MIKFKTKSGSLYEVDVEGKKFRRNGGTSQPTSRTGMDGEWKSFSCVSDVEVGLPVIVDWTGSGECTVTSKVVEVL